MPLRDHFRPPVSTRASWEGFHGMWPAAIVRQMRLQQPPGYAAESRVHLGAQVEFDVARFETDNTTVRPGSDVAGGVATAACPTTLPIVSVETELPDFDEYEVQVYDVQRGRTLVAVIEIVSPDISWYGGYHHIAGMQGPPFAHSGGRCSGRAIEVEPPPYPQAWLGG